MKNLVIKLFVISITLVFIETNSIPIITATDDGNIIYVDDDNIEGPWDGSLEHPYCFIQQAIDNASYGDTIFVYPGRYKENIVIDKIITLIGEDRNTTIIDGMGRDSVIYLSANRVSISGFTIQNSGSNCKDAGISIQDSRDCDIEDNVICDNNYYGIWLENSSDSKIIDNIISDNKFIGIDIWYSNNCSIIGNNISDNSLAGLSIYESNSNNVINNVIRYNEMGILLDSSDNCRIINNTMMNNDIYINGDSLGNWNTHTIEMNTVNDKPIYYWKNMIHGELSEDAGEIILANCTYVTIGDQHLRDTTVGIEIGFSSKCRIVNSIITDNVFGISIWYSDNCSIKSNTILSNNMDGVSLYSSSSCIIEDNDISSNVIGIELTYSNSNNIATNRIKNNDVDGISISSSSNNFIIKCSIYGNNIGISIFNSSGTQIHYCNIYGNNDFGVYNLNKERHYKVDARWCWWGSILGPSHLNTPSGIRDKVGYNVLSTPWLILPSILIFNL